MLDCDFIQIKLIQKRKKRNDAEKRIVTQVKYSERKGKYLHYEKMSLPKNRGVV